MAKKAIKNTEGNLKKKIMKKKTKEFSNVKKIKKSPKPQLKQQQKQQQKNKKISSKLTGLIIVSKGIEGIAALEVKELIGKSAEQKEGALIFPIDSLQDLCLLAYRGQSFARVLLYLGEFVSEETDMQKVFADKKFDFSIVKTLVKDVRFAARCQRIGEHIFSKQDVEREFGKSIKDFTCVDLNNPNVVFFVYLFNSRYYVGIDFSGEIDTREYRIYSTPKELKASIAYSLLRIAGYDGKKKILDPFCGSGTIPIEAALFATNTSCRFYKKGELAFSKFDKFNFDFKKHEKTKIAKGIYAYDSLLHNVSISEKNSKVAGMHKSIAFSKTDVEWMDIKFEKNSLDIVCSRPIELSKMQDEKEIKKIYKDIFYNLDFVMKKGGKAAFVLREANLNLMQDAAINSKFAVCHKQDVWQGKELLKVIVFEKHEKK